MERSHQRFLRLGSFSLLTLLLLNSFAAFSMTVPPPSSAAQSSSVTLALDASLDVANGGSAQTVTISGQCGPSPSTFTGNGSVFDISMAPACAYTLTLPSGYSWEVTSEANHSIPSGTTCDSGTCGEQDLTYIKGFYKVTTLHGVSNSIQIFEPDYTLELANGSRFSYSRREYSLNYTRSPALDACYNYGGSNVIGDGCMWTEAIGCGCGDDWGAGTYVPHIIHVIFEDSDVLVLQYNSTSKLVQPQDNYTWVFYRSTDQFVWEIDETIAPGRPSAYDTGWNGYDQATSIFGQNTRGGLHISCLNSEGVLTTTDSGTIACQIFKASETSLKEYQFTGITYGEASGYDNASLYDYPVATSTPYYACSASNNGEMKCENTPETGGNGGAGTGAPITYSTGWSMSVTLLVYPTYNDNGTANTNAMDMAKYLYYSQFGNDISFSAWASSAYCNPSAPGGNTTQGCYPTNAGTGAGLLMNSYSMYVSALTEYPGSFSILNQSVGSVAQAGSNKLQAPLTFGSSAGIGQNVLVSEAGTTTSPSDPTASQEVIRATEGNPIISTSLNTPDVSGNLSVVMPSGKNYYIVDAASTITGDTTVRTLTYSISGAGPTVGCDTVTGEASEYVRQINATTWDFEYKDSTYGNWVGYVVGLYGAQNTQNTTVIAESTYSNGCHVHPVITLYLIDDTIGHSYSNGSYMASVYVLPHFGNITTVAEVDDYITKNIIMGSQDQMFASPASTVGSSPQPLTLEAYNSQTLLVYVNKTGVTGYDALMLRKTSGSFTSYFLWNSATSGMLASVSGAATSWSETLLSDGIYNVTVTWTSAGGKAGSTIEFEVAPPVTIPIDCIVAESGAPPSNSFTVYGGSPLPSPSTIGCSTGGTITNVLVQGSTSIMVNASSGQTNTRYRFSVSSVPSITVSSNSCSTGTCSTWTITAYYQLQNTYEATPSSPSTWDSSYLISATGTVVGVGSASQTIGKTSSGKGPISAALWFDYNLTVSLPASFVDANSGTWNAAAPTSFIQNTGGNVNNVPYALTTEKVTTTSSTASSSTLTTTSASAPLTSSSVLFSTTASQTISSTSTTTSTAASITTTLTTSTTSNSVAIPSSYIAIVAVNALALVILAAVKPRKREDPQRSRSELATHNLGLRRSPVGTGALNRDIPGRASAPEPLTTATFQRLRHRWWFRFREWIREAHPSIFSSRNSYGLRAVL